MRGWWAILACGLIGCSSSNDVGEGGDTGDAGGAQGGDANTADGAYANDGSGGTDGSNGDGAVTADASSDAPTTDGALTCPSPPRADALAAQRDACAFKAGDRAAATLGLSDAERSAIPIKHIVVIMKENRSFDHMLGALKKLQPDADTAPPTFTNKDLLGNAVTPFHLTTTCVSYDPDHQWNAMHTQVNAGAMDGFVKSAATSTLGDGHFVMGQYDEKDLPFYYFLASTYAISDRHFASVRSGTFPNRDYLLLATSDKVTQTQYFTWPDPSLPNIFEELTAKGVPWGVYADDHPLEESINIPAKNFEKTQPWSPVQKLIDDFKNDTVPSVVFVDGIENGQDEHPTSDLQIGEAWTKRIYDAAVASPAWSSTALLLTYDEAGGFADHVPPPEHTCVARPADSQFSELGVRVPFIAISPWARRHYVSHGVQQHTSITRFIEAVFDLPAMTARDANSDALFDLFDFKCAPAPVPAAPATGTSGCGNHVGDISIDKVSFAPGETISVHFSGGPANAKDWIAVYPRTDTVHSGSTLWNYCGSNTHTATTGVSSGTVTLDANSANNASSWPLASGTSWTAYYLLDDGYTSIASVQFDIH